MLTCTDLMGYLCVENEGSTVSLGGVGAVESQPDHVAVLGEDAFGRQGKGAY